MRIKQQKIDWYYTKLLELYCGFTDEKGVSHKGMSMRKLSKKTGISLNSVFKGIQWAKKHYQLNEK